MRTVKTTGKFFSEPPKIKVTPDSVELPIELYTMYTENKFTDIGALFVQIQMWPYSVAESLGFSDFTLFYTWFVKTVDSLNALGVDISRYNEHEQREFKKSVYTVQ